jgi:hypothetical protein
VNKTEQERRERFLELWLPLLGGLIVFVSVAAVTFIVLSLDQLVP